MAEEPPHESLRQVPLGGTWAQAMQRLQVGIFGLASMILMIGLANIIMNQAREAEAGVVPEAAPTVVPTDSPSPASDPLADAGVGPDMPAEPQVQVQPNATVAPNAQPPAVD
jgi:hypothetical protein